MNKSIAPLFFLIILSVSCAQLKNIKEKVSVPDRPNDIFRVAWAKNLDPVYNTGNLPIGTSSPYIFEDLVYMGTLAGKMKVFELDTGRLIWEKDEDQPLNAQAVVFGDTVIYGSKFGRLFARHYLTGELKYAIDLGAPIESSAIVNGGRMFIQLRDHKIVALDAATGKVFWTYLRSVPYSTTLQRVSRVLPYKNKLIVGFADGNLVSLSMEEGVVTWEQKISEGVKFLDVDVDPVYFQGAILAGSAAGKLKFIDPENGVIKRSVNLTIGHAPFKLKDAVIVGTVFGEVAIVDGQGNILKKKQLSKNGISSIEQWKQGFAVSTMSGKLFFLDPTNLDILAEHDLGHDQSAVFGYLQQKDGKLAVYSSRNRLYVFK